MGRCRVMRPSPDPSWSRATGGGLRGFGGADVIDGHVGVGGHGR